MSREFRAEIRKNIQVAERHNLLGLAIPDSVPEPQPGQFFMVGVSSGNDPLLKRAFSLFRKTEEGIEILYRVVGKGTSILRDLKQGAVLDVIGPLGSFYPLPKSHEVPVIVAGGIGVAPVYPLVEKLNVRATVILGARSREELLMSDSLKSMSGAFSVCTDDGSTGAHGRVTDLLAAALKEKKIDPSNAIVYSCGPKAMLKEIAKITIGYRIKAYVSLEENMACGIGACLGCIAKTRDGYKRVCKEGPVFSAAEIIWE